MLAFWTFGYYWFTDTGQCFLSWKVCSNASEHSGLFSMLVFISNNLTGLFMRTRVASYESEYVISP